MSNVGKVKVVVKSRRVPIRTVEFTTHPIFPVGTLSTPVGSYSGLNLRKGRIVVYESVLDVEQRRAIDEGQRLACNLGLDLEVVDKSKLSFFGRLLTSLGSNVSATPTVMVFSSDQDSTGSIAGTDLIPTEAV